ncbi:MAG: potassium uptake protein, TrkH family [Lachnospiraceae bacterium]|nr:potassium uptake protein, TrkH family [Lachnospiraceae bacterium]
MIRKKINLNIYQTITLTFVLIILSGAILLTLPFASVSKQSCGFLTALFTSTSAVCVTGLSVVDIKTTYSLFGQIVLLILMETGGLGFMSIITVLFHIVNHKKDVQTLALSAESLGLDDIKSISRIQRRLILGSLSFETLGAVILSICFLPMMKVPEAIWFGIFHAVSAFCNAGFDLMGYFEPGSSLITANSNPLILITIALLIIIGGIGFMVWDDIAVAHKSRNWSIYTRIVISVTSVLIVAGTVAFFLIEKDNPDTIGNMSLLDKIINSFFQSVTPRTAGFASVDQGKLEGASAALTSILMMVGGSAGSTAGGIKTATFLILLKTMIANLQGKKNVTLFHRTITDEQLRYAFTVIEGFVIVSVAGGFLIGFTSDVGFMSALFESISALATVGLSLGITSSLSPASCITAIILMYIGRVGLLTLTLGFFKAKEDPNIKYPTAKIMIG